MKTTGEKLSPIFVELEQAIWEHESIIQTQPFYTDDALRAASKIFISVLMDKMYSLQEGEKMPFNHRYEFATKCGDDIRKLIKIYTGIDSHDFYK